MKILNWLMKWNMNEICCSDEVAEAAFFLGFKKNNKNCLYDELNHKIRRFYKLLLIS